VLVLTLIEEISSFFLLIDAHVGQIIIYLGGAMFRLSLRTAIALLILAILDYAYQRWQHEKDIRMSKREIQDEMKMLEGDPKIRARRRQIQAQLARQRMMTAVPKADVVVTNPTSLAIAIEYAREMSAPKVVAKGAGPVAERIREIAAEHEIPMVERKPLAQALYRSCEVGDDVPEELWQAVAEILAFVYQMGKSSSML
jgi:flagellar biosynthetic protein FlhB